MNETTKKDDGYVPKSVYAKLEGISLRTAQRWYHDGRFDKGDVKEVEILHKMIFIRKGAKPKLKK